MVAGELLDVSRLVLEIELQQHRIAELGDDPGRRVDAGLFDHALEEAGQVEEQVGVAADLLLDPGALHLHHHLFTAGERGAVHLRDGRARHRLGVDGGEELVRGPAQPFLDQLEHRLHRHWGRAILKMRELGDEVGR